MMKRFFLTISTLFLLVVSFSITAAAAEPVNYLNGVDYIVIAPAEKWQDGKRTIVPSKEWELTGQNYGNIWGDDVQLYQYGVSSKLHVLNLHGMDGKYIFKLQLTDYQETAEGLVWDVKGGSTKSGKIIHLWKNKATNDDSQYFYLEADDDNDPETFYIKNYHSNKYLVPEAFFESVDKNKEGVNWDLKATEGFDGPNVLQSNLSFRWRIHVLNREADGTKAYAEWMSRLPDRRYLSQLTIPGTHDACTANVEGGEVSSANFYACQKYFIDEQLLAGIRAFDLRTCKKDGTFVMAHGDSICREPGRGNTEPKYMELGMVISTMRSYLMDHTKEAVIATVKIEGDGSSDITVKRDLAKMLLNYEKYFYQWYTDGDPGSMKSPQLGDVRGKIVLLSRVDFSGIAGDDFTQDDLDTLLSYMGPDLSKWDDNYDDHNGYAQIISGNIPVKVWVQDDWHCDANEKREKFLNTIHQLNGNAPNYIDIPDNKDFIFNYTSATMDKGTLTPLLASRNLSALILHGDIFNNNPRGGIIMMDFANKALAQIMVKQNDIYRIIIPDLHIAASAQSFNSILTDSSQTPRLLSADDEQSTPSESTSEIIWPTGATVTYGYILGEAKLNFDEAALNLIEADASKTIPGFFYFKNGADILPVKNGEPDKQTLIFKSYDGAVEESREIPITVKPRPLPIKVGTYEVEYGEAFDVTQAAFPTAGGFFLPSDTDKLNEVIKSAGLHREAVDKDGNEFTFTAETKPCSGSILLKADHPENVVHPNYATFVENGIWVIQPRTVSVHWSYTYTGWDAEVGNIINGDEVFAVVNPAPDGQSATLTLGGADADSYLIAEGDEFSGNVSFSDEEDDTDESKCTIPLSDDSIAAHLEGTTVVPELSGKEITALLNNNSEVSIDISNVEGAESLRIPSAMLSAQSIEIRMAEGVLTLDKATLEGFTRQGGDPELSIRQETDSQGRPLFSLTASIGGKAAEGFAGIVTAKLPYRLPAGSRGEDIVVALRTEKGIYEQTDCTYDAQTAMAVARLQHFSDYVIAELPLDDMEPKNWDYAGVLNAYLSGFMQGTDARSFSPEETATRAMLVTVLWRLDGAPAPSGPSNFADVPAGAWYADAVAWAGKNGIVYGYSKDRFNPLDELSREQMMTILYRYEQYHAESLPVDGEKKLDYADANDVSDWAYEAVCWCAERGITNGVGENLLAPAGKSSRAQLAAFLTKYIAQRA